METLGSAYQASDATVVNESSFNEWDESSGSDSKILEDTATIVEVGSMLQRGLMEYGCEHYRRRCKMRAPCCGEVFSCRHCHNEEKNVNEADPLKRHEMPRKEVHSVICALCSEEQPVQQVCRKCGVSMGEYFCGICKFYDDKVSKQQYHCDACGICRVGGRDNFFHCERCGCCYTIQLEANHHCVEKSMHHNCPICFEYLFESMREIAVMNCGHTMHLECKKEMFDHGQYSCPICSKSLGDMSRHWAQLDAEVAETPMPEIYRSRKVTILCNDCEQTNEIAFNFVALKCSSCGSYNTRQTRSFPTPPTQSS